MIGDNRRDRFPHIQHTTAAYRNHHVRFKATTKHRGFFNHSDVGLARNYNMLVAHVLLL
ncbi:Uncharacterised protein [Vibrio cholerae]|nr:Uncharacterised protein [Vibrio cholerae]